MPAIDSPSVQELFIEADKHGYAWAIYREPGESDMTFIAGECNALEANSNPSFWINSFDKRLCVIQHLSLAVELVRDLNPLIKTPPLAGHEMRREEYKNMVSEAISQINIGVLQKVVLSRTKKITLPAHFQPFTFFAEISQVYTDAFSYLLFHPEYGLWTGCSPELLLKCEGNEIETMSLAGTGKGPNDFTDKEKKEQAIVSHYIRDTLAPYCDSVTVAELATKKAGQIYHLYTRITGKKKPGISVREVADALHPTPAVCGTPMDKAMEFIRQNEPHDRRLYSGFLGPVLNDRSCLYVNLRCMQISGNEALLYAGAGIVEGSDPEAEWQETNKKMDTLLRIIFPGSYA